MTSEKVKITIKNNGPLRVEGGAFEICDATGKTFDLGGRAAVSICRCGQSQKQPFCDGSHGQCGFCSEVAAYDLPPKA
jgi:CDGSH-type Zn-finger protein